MNDQSITADTIVSTKLLYDHCVYTIIRVLAFSITTCNLSV